MTATLIEGDRLRVHFDDFGLDSYGLFLKCKGLPESETVFHDETETYSITAPARFAPLLGVALPRARAQDLPLADCLFDDQRAIVEMALAAKRFACWSDCGLGKTLVGLEWAKHVCHRTGGRVLIVTMNEIVPQWLLEAAKFYGDSLPLCRLETREAMRRWCAEGGGAAVAVTNYEKWNHKDPADQVVSEAKLLGGVVLDESSRLKTGGGKQKWSLIKSCKGIEYKLSLTATPAPNEVMEFASQAAFLEKMRDEGEILWTYFTRDNTTHRWTVKPHARSAFFRFMAGWSIYVRDPRRYGWRADFPQVPPPVFERIALEPTAEQLDYLSEPETGPQLGETDLAETGRTLNFVQASALSQVAKGFRYHRGEEGSWKRIASRKPAAVADLVAREVASGAQVLVWTVFDAESALLAEQLHSRAATAGRFAVLTGKTGRKQRSELLQRFQSGEVRVLLSLPSMLGWGMNLQCASAMVFSGWNFSYEQHYQAIRRAYRFGQNERLRVYLPYVRGLGEDAMLDALDRKAAEHEAAIAEMEKNYIEALRGLKGGAA